MGGGKMTRPDFDQPQASDACPETEFYRLLQKELSQNGEFALPGVYVAFKPPLDRKIFAEDVWDYCTFSSQPKPGYREIFAPSRLRLLYDNLPAAPNGTPLALLLTEQPTRRTTAVRILPPVAFGDALPPMPDSPAALTLQLTFADLDLADSDPAALGLRLAGETANKTWLRHPKIEQWVERALAVAQRAFDREQQRQSGTPPGRPPLEW